MSHVVLLDLPDELIQRAQAVTAYTHRVVDDVLAEWLSQAAMDVSPDQLPDDEVLALCDMELTADEQRDVWYLVAFAGIAGLPVERITALRRGRVIDKARAMAVAADRHLR
jgi:hypothetical protein